MRTNSNRWIKVLAIASTFGFLFGMTPLGNSTEHVRPAGLERAGEVIPDHYIVTVHESADVEEVVRDYRALGAGVNQVYEYVAHGFAARVPAGLVKRLESDSRVVSVEPDRVIQLESTGNQNNPPSWGLDRTDQQPTKLDGVFSYAGTGEGVRAYIVDTGVRSTHEDFGGRVAAGYTGSWGSTEDCHGHGTHVAGTLAGASHGIAKAATVIPVRVFDCNGSGSGSVYFGGIDWILANHPAGMPGVVNFSLTGGASSQDDAAVAKLVDAGLAVAVAAGNQSTDACTRSPAREPSVLTVAATTSGDARASYSNFGTCVDLFAPGSSIRSTLSSSDTATGSMSGTSMATPHVAGVAAVLFGLNPTATAREIHAAVLTTATSGVVSSAGSGSPNLLLFANGAADGDVTATEPEPNKAPVAQFGVSCTDLSCAFDASASSDADGTIASYSWSFGDGAGGSGVKPTHAYASDGTYSVTLTVTDDAGATTSTSGSVTVSAPASATEPEPGIALAVSVSKTKGVVAYHLGWSGASTATVDVYRDGAHLTTVKNTGAYVEDTGLKGSPGFTYQVCEAGTTVCSASQGESGGVTDSGDGTSGNGNGNGNGKNK